MFPSRNTTSGVFPMTLLAGASILILVVAAIWQSTIGNTISAQTSQRVPPIASTTSDISSEETASTSTSLTPLGATVLDKLANTYSNLNASGGYTSTSGIAAAKDLAATIAPKVSSHTYIEADISTTPDSSRTRILSYRSDLQNALKPLLDNTSYELSTYAHYVATHDPHDLVSLQATALNYHSAVLNTARLTVPESALTVHLGILNALDAFGSTLATQVQSASDPYASAALLSAYNTAETQVFLSFDALARYFRDKIPS